MGAFKEAHGGALKELYLAPEAAEAEKARARDYASWDLTARQLCDIELLLNGAFSPLEGFLGKADADSVIADMRLQDGTLWPMPVTLDVSEAFAEGLKEGDAIALRDAEGVLVATMDVSDIWAPDKRAEAAGVFGTTDETHPGVHYLLHEAGPVYLGGRLKGVEPPTHYDFKHLRHSPAQVRQLFQQWGWRRVVAFQTRNPMHRAHHDLTFRAAREAEAHLIDRENKS